MIIDNCIYCIFFVSISNSLVSIRPLFFLFFNFPLSQRWRNFYGPTVNGGIVCSQNSLIIVWWCRQLLSWFLANAHFPRRLRQSANDGYNTVKPRAVYRSPEIYLMTEEKHRKFLLGDRLMKTVRPVPSPQMGFFTSK